MEFGMFHQFPSLPGRSDADSFAEAFDQIDAAEELGLDVMWLAELHFDPQRSVLSAPLSIASAIAARTRRIKIGIAVQVLPLCHPLRLAEEAATVDQISRGRLIFGVGRSGLPRTYEDYGVSYAESRDRFAEVLDIVEQAWSQPKVNFEGRYYRFNNIAVAPRPFQQPLPSMRIAAASPDTYPAVGARGLPIFINARHGSFAEFAPAVREYRAAYEAAGHPGRGRVYLRVPTYLAETAGRAREEPRDSLMHFYREQTERLRDSMSRGGTRAIEGRAERLERLEKLTYDEALEGQVLIGTPESVGERLRALQDELGIDGILAELNCGGLIPHAQVMTALRLLCEEVMPRFH
ncbi:MAG TPA: LLM class flavin-dependent oxidoreductase [Stellaceae bacterium]|jgi:alkanesulfonate monooxygenase SsuD/methylene tetrahydromethanopterin reductase-like flavin-dependent oxidoreductase (luciferase family)